MILLTAALPCDAVGCRSAQDWIVIILQNEKYQKDGDGIRGLSNFTSRTRKQPLSYGPSKTPLYAFLILASYCLEDLNNGVFQQGILPGDR